MAKGEGAFLTIGEVSKELGVAQHILRYWETRFPQLRPIQRAGNRRYYRPADVALARRIHALLEEQGYTIKGVQKVLTAKSPADSGPLPVTEEIAVRPPVVPPTQAPSAPSAPVRALPENFIVRLEAMRDRLRAALAAGESAGEPKAGQLPV